MSHHKEWCPVVMVVYVVVAEVQGHLRMVLSVANRVGTHRRKELCVESREKNVVVDVSIWIWIDPTMMKQQCHSHCRR